VNDYPAAALVPPLFFALLGAGKLPRRTSVPDRYVVLVVVVVVVCVLALGQRIPPVMAGIVLLPTASLFPAFTYSYYLVFALPIAALAARDPDGAPGWGMFDRLGPPGDRRRAVGICVSVPAALSIAQIAVPGGPGVRLEPEALVLTTAKLTPLLWLVACATIIVSYARRPAPQDPSKESDR
jgi:hypothetical protein